MKHSALAVGLVVSEDAILDRWTTGVNAHAGTAPRAGTVGDGKAIQHGVWPFSAVTEGDSTGLVSIDGGDRRSLLALESDGLTDKIDVLDVRPRPYDDCIAVRAPINGALNRREVIGHEVGRL